MKDLATKNTKDTKKVWPTVRLGDVCKVLTDGVVAPGAAAKGGDVGRDEIVGDGGAVFETAFGYFCQAMGYDKMAHIDAVFKGVGT